MIKVVRLMLIVDAPVVVGALMIKKNVKAKLNALLDLQVLNVLEVSALKIHKILIESAMLTSTVNVRVVAVA